jgi:hypothetical protein
VAGTFMNGKGAVVSHANIAITSQPDRETRNATDLNPSVTHYAKETSGLWRFRVIRHIG